MSVQEVIVKSVAPFKTTQMSIPEYLCFTRYDEYLLKTITWKDATGLTGCYAINAAQDGGTCKPCIEDLEQVCYKRVV